VASSSATTSGATPKAIPGATSVHTGEPWGGATPLELGSSGFGTILMGLGLRRRRRYVPTRGSQFPVSA
jgi:hypothetical protein